MGEGGSNEMKIGDDFQDIIWSQGEGGGQKLENKGDVIYG